MQQASAACLALGGFVGVLMARGTPWSHGSLLGAHLALNMVGWLGTAIIGTLHTFFPSLTQTRLRYPRLQLPTSAVWLMGVAILGRIRKFALAMPIPHPMRDASLTIAVGVAIAGLALSRAAGLTSLSVPATVAALATGAMLASRVIALAARALAPRRVLRSQ